MPGAVYWILLGLGLCYAASRIPKSIREWGEQRRIDRRVKACYELGFSYGIRGLPPDYYQHDTDLPHDVIARLDKMDQGFVSMGWSAGFEKFTAHNATSN